MARRSVAQWNALSDSQRKRYIAAGRTGSLTGTPGLSPVEARRYYISGGDLGGGRGYHAPKNAAPKVATQKSMIGTANTKDLRTLRSWRKNKAPAWIPKSNAVMGDDVAAILSQIGLQPRNWKDVQIYPNGDGSFTMRVTSKRSDRVRDVILPNRDAVLQVRDLFNQYSREAAVSSKAERNRLNKQWQNAAGNSFNIGFTITTDPKAFNEPSRNLTTTGTALNRRKRQ